MRSIFFPGLTKSNSFTQGFQSSSIKRSESDCFINGYHLIGKSIVNIQKLNEIFNSGTISENIYDAKTKLIEILKISNTIPKVIICESIYDMTEIQDLHLFLTTHSLFCTIPIVLDGSLLSEKEWITHKRAKIVDEILLIGDTTNDHLEAKCRFLKKIKSGEFNGNKNNFVQTQGLNLKNVRFSLMIKRIIEILISALALIVLSPLFLLISVAIKVESKGSVFYISKRAGRGYRIFNFIKFRTMKAGSDRRIDEYSHLNQYSYPQNTGAFFIKINNDPRITKVGSLLRKSSLDELPQLINVFLGDMSLVGNRPLPLYEAATLTTDEYAGRFMAPAGITGLWQIKKRGKINMSVEERISLDIDYANRSNFIYDLWIIANTPTALFQKENV